MFVGEVTYGSGARLGLSTNEGGDGSGRGTGVDYQSFHQLMIMMPFLSQFVPRFQVHT